VSDPTTKSCKINISDYILKYETSGMKEDRKQLFDERTFLEMLEDISNALLD
jgi:hypothetical protein